MGVEVKFSKRSLELIKDYLSSCGPQAAVMMPFSTSSVDMGELVAWLSREIPAHLYSEKNAKKTDFILTDLRMELLRDLYVSMKGNNNKKAIEEDQQGNKQKFVLLAIAGTLLAACEGFDGITSMMSTLSLPSVPILAVGILCSVLSVVVFYGFDLVQVSKNLGVKLTDAPKLLDIYLMQMEEIQAIRKKINTYCLAELSAEELEQLKVTIDMLQIRFMALTKTSKQFDEALNSPKMKIAKTAVSWVAGLLFFGSGFFAGQSVAMFLLGFLMTAVTPTFWPVILFSLGIGLCAFSLYWYVERVGVTQLVSGWFGLDEEKIEKLCNQDNMEKELNKLENLKEKVRTTANLTYKVTSLQNKLESIELDTMSRSAKNSRDVESPLASKSSQNIYSFHSSSRNRKDHHQDAVDYDEVSGYSSQLNPDSLSQIQY